MIRSAFLEPNEPPVLLNSVQEINNKRSDPKGFLWVSLESATNEEIDQVLKGVFNFHPLAIEDCQSTDYQSAKVDDFIDFLFIIAHAIKPEKDFRELLTFELDLFLGENFLVTCFTDSQMLPIEKTWTSVQRDFRLSNFGPDFLCHSILDILVDDYMPLVDEMESEVELLEDIVLEKPAPSTLEKLITLKHSIVSLRRIISPLREAINRLARDEFAQVDSQSRYYFRDVYDHLVRTQDLIDTIRDIISSAMDIYINSTSLRLNEIMKTLTILSSIFLPLSFIAGVFGMNFVNIPGGSHNLGFYLAFAGMVLLGIAMLIYFRMRRWF
jgi:magnesium transporter